MLKILVAIDGSSASLQAVRHVAFLARGGLRLQAVLAHVQERPGPLELLAARDPSAIGRAGLQAGEHFLEPARELLDAAGVGHEDEVRMADGDPAHTLLDIAQAHHCAALVVGAHRAGLLRHVLLGSTARTLVAESPVPVTVVRDLAEPRRHGASKRASVGHDRDGSSSGACRDEGDTGDGGGGDGGGGGGGD